MIIKKNKDTQLVKYVSPQKPDINIYISSKLGYKAALVIATLQEMINDPHTLKVEHDGNIWITLSLTQWGDRLKCAVSSAYHILRRLKKAQLIQAEGLNASPSYTDKPHLYYALNKEKIESFSEYKKNSSSNKDKIETTVIESQLAHLAYRIETLESNLERLIYHMNHYCNYVGIQEFR